MFEDTNGPEMVLCLQNFASLVTNNQLAVPDKLVYSSVQITNYHCLDSRQVDSCLFVGDLNRMSSEPHGVTYCLSALHSSTTL